MTKNTTAFERESEQMELSSIQEIVAALKNVRYDTRMAFLRDQIELKDQRMDRKDKIIEKLMDKVLK